MCDSRLNTAKFSSYAAWFWFLFFLGGKTDELSLHFLPVAWKMNEVFETTHLLWGRAD